MSVLNDITKHHNAYWRQDIGDTESDFTKPGMAALNEMQAQAADPRVAAMGAAKLGPAAQMLGTSIDRSGDEYGRSFQSALAGQYAAQAAGAGPSLAAMQMRSGLDQNVAGTYAAMANGKGTANPLATRAAMMGGAATGLGLAGQGAMGRMAEVNAGGAGLTGTLGAMRSTDDQAATAQASLDARTAAANADFANKYKLAQAGFSNDAASRNLQALLAQRASNDAMTKFALAGKAALAEGDVTAQERYWNDLTGNALNQNALNFQGDQFNQRALLGGAAAAGSGIVALSGMGGGETPGDITSQTASGYASPGSGDGWSSDGASGPDTSGGSMSGGDGSAWFGSDERLKGGVVPADARLEDFLDQVKAYSYRYSNPVFGDKRYVSPMAQDLEKSEIGKSLVKETPAGKMVDYGRAAGVGLAASAMLNKRLSRVEKLIKAGAGAAMKAED